MRPRLPIYTNRSVAALLEGSGARVHTVGHGDAFEVGGIPVRVYGEWHAPIHPDVRQVRNIGFLIGHKIFHPGDALTDPGVPVDLLLAPLHGLYTKNGLTLDYIRQLKPRRVSPIHDASLNQLGQLGADLFFAEKANPPLAPGTGSPYTRLNPAQPITL